MSECLSRHIGDTHCLFNTPDEPFARLILAHGAGAPMDSQFMARMAELLCEQSLEVVRFEFPYMAKRRQTGRKAPPDRHPVLLGAWERLAAALTEDISPDRGAPPLFIGGKSMGGRMATMVADAVPAKGVICLGYPFHPRSRPEKPRTEHLRSLTTPTLILQGTRDPMGGRETVTGYTLSTAVLLAWMETGDHDLKPLRSSGYSHDDYLRQAAERIAAFIRLAV
jgi:predicted alpha/beta-hydrolase family hydrolase